jgi:hypothetical protein
MAINAADARQLARVILMAYGEDYSTIASILRPIRTEFPAINWMGELTTIATTWPPFLESGLSVQWWLSTVDLMSQP